MSGNTRSEALHHAVRLGEQRGQTAEGIIEDAKKYDAFLSADPITRDFGGSAVKIDKP